MRRPAQTNLIMFQITLCACHSGALGIVLTPPPPPTPPLWHLRVEHFTTPQFLHKWSDVLGTHQFLRFGWMLRSWCNFPNTLFVYKWCLLVSNPLPFKRIEENSRCSFIDNQELSKPSFMKTTNPYQNFNSSVYNNLSTRWQCLNNKPGGKSIARHQSRSL